MSEPDHTIPADTPGFRHLSNVIRLALIHGIYFVITGLWPLLHMASFTAVTGPKTDLWLVRTVGVLVLVIGAGLLLAVAKKEITFPMILTAFGAAAGLMLIDLTYVFQGVISPVYLLDAVLEGILLVCWVVFIYHSDEYELFHTSRR